MSGGVKREFEAAEARSGYTLALDKAYARLLWLGALTPAEVEYEFKKALDKDL
jgi:hypothetical protein